MKKLLPVLLACATLLSGCGDREKYAAHRAERSKPKTEVSAGMVAIRRAPYPNLTILPGGHLRVDDIEIPLKPAQQEVLQDSFVKLQILRQNTLTDAATTDAATTDGAGERSVPIQHAPGQPPFPADLATGIPEFKEYGEALANLRAVR
ncbi:hypothetical protein ABB34_02620 [Stenotrophomonas daejeonensis]|uniref:Lipoprotein n=1 Tax=Stenotrophomonas daejeonensis TaxID=659018 RepID=A0A0R0EAD3_9GAMM|nr:hypothetical protein [Stenotrophomonas daejeonensis]KRG87879.1 hypothetical protein ABB34_02620 [Stenotrophomonas daejeonensis]